MKRLINKILRRKKNNTAIKLAVLAVVAISALYLAGIALGYGQNNNSDGLVLDITLNAENYNSSTKTFTDQSGQANNGISANNATFVPGQYGESEGAMSFNGSSDEVKISGTSYKSPSVTVSFWLKPQSQNKRHVLVTTWSGFTTELNSDGTFRWGLSGPSAQYYGSQKIPWNKWSYVTGTFDNTTKRQCIYINGDLSQCQTVSGSINYGGGDLYVSGSWDRVKGEFGNIKIFNRALSSEEIKGLYNESKPKLQISSIEKGLIAHWPLDGVNYNSSTNRVTDVSAYSNHGTNYGANLAEDRMGRTEGAMSFSTANQRIVTPFKTNNYFNNDDEFTLSTWINIRSYPTSEYDRTGVVGSNQWNGGGFGLHINNIGLYMVTGTDSSTTEYSVPLSNFPTSKWHHVVFKYGNSLMTMYKNGQEIAQTSRGTWSTNNLNFLIGFGSQGGWNRTFQGSVAETRIYNRALSEDEIKSLYNTYSQNIGTGSLQKGLILDMPLTSQYTKGGSAGSEVLVDRSAYSNDGQNYGASLATNSGATFDGINDYVVSKDDIRMGGHHLELLAFGSILNLRERRIFWVTVA